MTTTKALTIGASRRMPILKRRVSIRSAGMKLRSSFWLDGELLKEVRFDGVGCAISLAAASMMTEILEGKSKEEVRHIGDLFKALMHGEDVTLPDEMEDLESLKGVANFPLRVKCAMLPWMTPGTRLGQ